MSLSIILAFGAMFGWGIADFLIQRTIQKVGWLEAIWWINIGSFIFLLPFVWKSFFTLNGPSIIFLIILGIISIASATAHFKALEAGKLSVVEIILFFELPLTILLGMAFLHNSLSLYQVLLILCLFVGVVLISLDLNKIQRHQFWFFWQRTKIFLERGVWLAVITAVLLALTNFFVAIGAVNIDPLLAIWFPWTLGALVCLTYFIYKGRLGKVLHDGRQYWPLILAMAVIDIMGWLFFSFSISKEGELAIIAAVSEGYIVIAMLLGLKFNKEKIRGWQYVGAAITIICSLLIGLSNH
ncbi:MAG: EamA family transporter [Patescibacteria group bacterium]